MFVSSETVIFVFLSLPGVFIFEVFLPHEVCENESALRKMANCVVFLDTLITKMTAQISVEKCNKFHGNAWQWSSAQTTVSGRGQCVMRVGCLTGLQ